MRQAVVAARLAHAAGARGLLSMRKALDAQAAAVEAVGWKIGDACVCRSTSRRRGGRRRQVVGPPWTAPTSAGGWSSLAAASDSTCSRAPRLPCGPGAWRSSSAARPRACQGSRTRPSATVGWRRGRVAPRRRRRRYPGARGGGGAADTAEAAETTRANRLQKEAKAVDTPLQAAEKVAAEQRKGRSEVREREREAAEATRRRLVGELQAAKRRWPRCRS